jgi:hypothetical protein
MVDPKAARPYVKAAIGLGLDRERGGNSSRTSWRRWSQPSRPGVRRGPRVKAWQVLLEHRAFIAERLDAPMLDFSQTIDDNASRERLPLIGTPRPPGLTATAKLIARLR